MTPPQELSRLARALTLRHPNLALVPDSENFPWIIRDFQKKLQLLESRKELLLPNLQDQNRSIAVFSDYGGDHKKSNYLTYSFLVCALDQIGPFTSAMKTLRENAGLNKPLKEIAFKDFHYGPVSRSLDRYLLNLSNLVNGYLLTVIVEKSVESLFGNDKQALAALLETSGYGRWKPSVAEKLLRIVHFSAYLVALLSRADQKVFWMTDHDSIAQPTERFKAVLGLFSSILSQYCPHKLSTVGGAVPFEEKTPLMLDLLSATDIVAGSLEHYFTHSRTDQGTPQIKQEADRVLCWLTGQGIALKRQTIIIKAEERGIVSGTLRLQLKTPNVSELVIPVSLD